MLSLSSGGSVREYQLIKRVQFRLHDKEGNDWMPAGEIVVRRSYTFNETQVLARDLQGAIVRMAGAHTDIAERKKHEDLIRRQLEELQRWQAVMLGQPEALVAPSLTVPGKIEGVAERLGRVRALGDG